jgi:hypothetical protein
MPWVLESVSQLKNRKGHINNVEYDIQIYTYARQVGMGVLVLINLVSQSAIIHTSTQYIPGVELSDGKIKDAILKFINPDLSQFQEKD